MTGANLSAELLGTAYGFVRQLAMGGMGEVAIVEHVALGEQRVMKLLRADYAKNTDLTTRLRTEARLLTRLQHENLVRVLDFGFSAKGRPFLVTELLRGEPLSTALKGSTGMPEREALEIARQTLLGLERVHEAGFVHRDLKPDNLFLVKNEGQTTVKILDFGVARILTPADRAALGQLRPTDEGMIVGTPSYLSPEQALGKPCDARADIYGLACTLYRMLAGAPLFKGETQLDILQAHVLETPTAPSLVASHSISPDVDALVLRGLAKKPEERFQTAREMREAVEAALGWPPPVSAHVRDAAPAPSPVLEARGELVAPAAGTTTPAPPAASKGSVRGDDDSEHGTIAVRSPLAPAIKLSLATPVLEPNTTLQATTPFMSPVKSAASPPSRRIGVYVGLALVLALAVVAVLYVALR